MSKYLVKKSGPLYGEVTISGSKNAVLPIMAATLLSDEKCELTDVPQLKDVEVMLKLLSTVGSKVVPKLKSNMAEIKTGKKISCEIPKDLANKMRASILLMGPILARNGYARIALPGGCSIGARPIELHLKGFKAMGAEIIEGAEFVEAKADKLVGCDIYLDFPSVGATENIMMAAVLAEGTTILENSAQEPEIVDLASFLNKMGAKIKGAGTDTIKIEGVKKVYGATHTIIPDRIEAGTFMVAAAITRGDVLIKNVVPDHIRPLIAKLRECGIAIEEQDEEIRVCGKDRVLIATDIKTLPYPGFPTDLQPQLMALLTTVEGESKIIENVFENRYMHINELRKMGANITFEGRSATIKPNAELKGGKVIATDLRAGAALVLAGLYANGVTEISDIYHVERGYEYFVEKFKNLGAKIKKID